MENEVEVVTNPSFATGGGHNTTEETEGSGDAAHVSQIVNQNIPSSSEQQHDAWPETSGVKECTPVS